MCPILFSVDETQIFDLNFTIGEVGLNEIKLVQKNQKQEAAVKYRMHSKNNENRPIMRPHTISSVSPYSSTNSLNSSDSSGIVMNQRLNNLSAPNRKKRVAPRPPSQNSIPENPETKRNHISSFNSSSMAHQNFHASSPNLAANNSVIQKSNSNQNDNIDYINDLSHSEDQNAEAPNSKRKTLSNRPLSIQFRRTSSEDYGIKCENYEEDNLFLGQNHSRTSSETSDITRDSSFPEPQPRKRPPIGKYLVYFVKNIGITKKSHFIRQKESSSSSSKNNFSDFR